VARTALAAPGPAPDAEPAAAAREGDADGPIAPDALSPGTLAAAARGDARAWEEITEVYGRRVFALVRSRFRSDELAEEITQSVLVTVATKLASGGYTEQGRFEPWLFRIAMNRVRDEARRRVRWAAPGSPTPESDVRERPGEHASPADAHDSGRADAGEVARLRAAMEELPDADREIIALRHHGGMSFKAMAELLEEPVGTLLARHHRALRKLKDCLSRHASKD
jgi:RNA polymerase sigma-70 factor (ECF subfamily)